MLDPGVCAWLQGQQKHVKKHQEQLQQQVLETICHATQTKEWAQGLPHYRSDWWERHLNILGQPFRQER